MKETLEICAKTLDLMRAYPTSLYGGFKNRRLFEDVEAYCMFIGYPRSGHSLMGSLLDAHPNIIIAQELGVLKYVHVGFSKRQIYYLLVENSRAFTEAGRIWSGYSYRVPNQWQGRFTKLQVVGDKQGQGATLRLQARPWLRQRLCNRIHSNIRFIHIIRNPYDNISTIFRKAREKGQCMELKDSIELYFSLCQTVADVKREVSRACFFELRLESFIDNPTTYLRELCRFLGTDASPEYLDDCASIVFKSPHRSRYEVQWDGESINVVEKRIDQFPFLQGYCYEG
jgi:hypothetical protein